MDWLQLLTGLLIAGESIILYTGMSLKKTEWINSINNAFVGFDIILGVLLIASAYGLITTQGILVIASILTHLIRDYDYNKKLPDRYAFNLPVLALLNIRLLGLVLILLQ